MDEVVSRKKTTATAAEILHEKLWLSRPKIGSHKEGQRSQSVISQLFGTYNFRYVGNTEYRDTVFPGRIPEPCGSCFETSPKPP
jgi:hypothetical protein